MSLVTQSDANILPSSQKLKCPTVKNRSIRGKKHYNFPKELGNFLAVHPLDLQKILVDLLEELYFKENSKIYGFSPFREAVTIITDMSIMLSPMKFLVNFNNWIFNLPLTGGLKHCNEGPDCNKRKIHVQFSLQDPIAIDYVISALDYGSEWTNIDLTGSRLLGDAGIRKFAPSIEDNQLLKSLKLGSCNLTCDGVTDLAWALSHKDCGVKYLDLSNNRFFDTGIIELADALLWSESLELLWMENVIFSSWAGEYLIDALEERVALGLPKCWIHISMNLLESYLPEDLICSLESWTPSMWDLLEFCTQY